jgi:hypothetical protein
VETVMAKVWVTVGAAAILASATLVVGLAARGTSAAAEVPTLLATAPDAGLIAIAGPVPGRIRVLYARNGGMALLQEISVPAGAKVRELSLSADGSDLFVATEALAYTVSTRSGRIEALALAAREERYAAYATALVG